MCLRVTSIAAAALLFLSLLPGTARAQDEHSGLRLRFWGGVDCRCVLSDNDTFDDPVFGTSETAQSGAAFALGGDVEYKLGKFFGLGLGIGYSDVTVDFTHELGAGVQDDSLGILPIFFAANLHLVNTESVDFYVGYLAAYIFYLNDPVFEVPGTGPFVVETNDEFTGEGFNLGADVAVNEDWAVNAAFRFVNADADSTHLLPVDPTFITVGATFKF